MIPVLVGLGVAAGIGYIVSNSNSSNDDDDYEERAERRRRRREREEKEKNKKRIKSEIESFKKTSKTSIKNKYSIDISFNGKEVNILDNENGKIGHLKEYLSQLKAENSEMENLINDLQREKDAI
jgi:hypothetical protein